MRVTGLPARAQALAQVYGVAELLAGTTRPSPIAPGTHIEWMALRRNGPRIIRNLQWDGRRPFRAFQFEIDDRQNTYTFIVPEDYEDNEDLGKGGV